MAKSLPGRYRGAAVTSLIPVTIVPLMPAARAVR